MRRVCEDEKRSTSSSADALYPRTGVFDPKYCGSYDHYSQSVYHHLVYMDHYRCWQQLYQNEPTKISNLKPSLGGKVGN